MLARIPDFCSILRHQRLAVHTTCTFEVNKIIIFLGFFSFAFIIINERINLQNFSDKPDAQLRGRIKVVRSCIWIAAAVGYDGMVERENQKLLRLPSLGHNFYNF